jgi:hypothetical protein
MIIYTTGSTKGNGKVSVYDSSDAKGAWTQKTTTEQFGSDRRLVTIEKRKITYFHP